MRARHTLTSVAVLAAVTALTGCGGDKAGSATAASTSGSASVVGTTSGVSGAGSAESAGSAGSSGSTSASSTSAAASTSAPPAASATTSFAKPAVGGRIDPVAFGNAVTKATEDTRYYHVVMTAPGESSAMTGDVARVSDSRTDLSLQASDGGIRVVDGSLYLYDPSSDGARPWVSIDKNSTNPFAQLMTGMIGATLASTGMTSTITQEAWSSAIGTYVGAEASGDHYHLDVPADVLMKSAFTMSDLMQGLPSDASSAVASADADVQKQLTQLKGKKVSYDFWVDSQMRPAKTAVDWSALGDMMIGSDGSGSGASSSDASNSDAQRVTIRTSRWGVPVTISVPPASQTQSIDEAMSSGMFGDTSSESGSSSSPSL